MKEFDLVVIGAGPGGYVAAIRAAQKGLKVAVVEKDSVGGCCLNRGCVPTKAIMHAAHLYTEIKHASNYGLAVSGVSFHMDEIYQNKNNTVATLRQGIEQLFKANKVMLIKGEATITSKNTVEVKGEGNLVLETDKILIATGGVPATLPLHLQNVEGVYTSDDILGENAKMFKHLVIVGGGVIGVEFASIFNAFGYEVTIVEALNKILPPMDKDISQNLSMILKKQGVKIHTGAMLKEIERSGDNITCRFEEKGEMQNVECDGVLVSIGRRASTAGLFENYTDVLCDRGCCVVNENFQTSVDSIYAIGDCTKGIQLAHMASAQGLNAVSHMVNETPAVDLNTVPSCVYTNPEIATVGITEAEAKEAGIGVKTGKYIMTGNAKSILSKQERGFIKVVFDAESHVLLGAQLMCARATDIISELSVAVSNGLTVEQLTQTIRPHPTFTEGVTEAVEDVEKMAVHIAPKGKL